MIFDNWTMFVFITSIAVLMVIIVLKLIYRHNPHVSEDYGSK